MARPKSSDQFFTKIRKVVLIIIQIPISLHGVKGWSSNSIDMTYHCKAEFKTPSRSENANYKIDLSLNSEKTSLTVVAIVTTRADAEFLKFALLPAPGQIRHQNSLLSGVRSLFDLSSPRRKVIFVPFNQINFQEDRSQLSKTKGNLIFESTIKPVYTGIIGYFEAHREIQIDLEKGELRYNVEGKDYYDSHAQQNRSTYYLKVNGPTDHYDGYHFGMICRDAKKHSKLTENP